MAITEFMDFTTSWSYITDCLQNVKSLTVFNCFSTPFFPTYRVQCHFFYILHQPSLIIQSRLNNHGLPLCFILFISPPKHHSTVCHHISLMSYSCHSLINFISELQLSALPTATLPSVQHFYHLLTIKILLVNNPLMARRRCWFVIMVTDVLLSTSFCSRDNIIHASFYRLDVSLLRTCWIGPSTLVAS